MTKLTLTSSPQFPLPLGIPKSFNNSQCSQASQSKSPFISDTHNTMYQLTEYYSKKNYSSWSAHFCTYYLSQATKKEGQREKGRITSILPNLCPHRTHYLFNKRCHLCGSDIRLKQLRIILPTERAQI